MKKNTSILLVVFVVLGGLLWYMTRTESKTTLTTGDWHFEIPEQQKIGHVFFADKRGHKIDLKKKDGNWILNDKYLANISSVKNLLSTLRRMKLKYRPAEAAKKNIIKGIASTGIKVEVYDLEDKPLKTFYIGDATNDERAVNMIMEGSSNPYVIHIPSFEGNFRTRFFLNPIKWRDKTIFKEDPDGISSVTVEYPKQEENSFVLNQIGQRDYSVSRLPDSKEPTSKHSLRKGMQSVFLDAFTNQIAEAFEKPAKKDSLMQITPFCKIKLDRKDGSFREMKLYPLIRKVGADKSGNPLPDPGINRYYALFENGELYLVQNKLMKKMLWAYDYFFEE